MAKNDQKNKNPGLTTRQRMALPILASAPSVAAAARLSNVGRRTLDRWLRDDDFREELVQLHQQSAELARAQLQGLTLQAILALGDALEDPNPDIRMRAIRTALSFSVKLNDIQKLREEVQVLEDALPLWSARHEH